MEDSLQEAVRRIREVVGEAHVLTSPEEVESHSRDTSTWQRLCAAVVYPSSTAEVARVVQVANEFGLPVWPYSKGKNWGYGATQGLREGAVIMILERMNRIIEVNEELAYAVVEPGVTQKQLNDHLKERNIKLWVDSTDSTTEGSVVGNALERGVGYTPYWDHFGHLCGLEVVLASGEVVRTGAGPENSLTWHTHKWGSGPYIEGLFSQSNFGIVTKAGVWLLPEPEGFTCFICEVEDERNLPAAVDSIRRLALDRVLQSNVHMVNDVLFMAQMMQYPYDLLDGGTYLSDETRAGLRRRLKVAPWTISGGIYGTHAQVRVSKKLIKKELSRSGRVTFLNDTSFGVMQRLLRFWQKNPEGPFAPLLSKVTNSSLEKLQVIPHVYPILKGVPGDYIVGFAYFKSRGPRPTSNIDPARDNAGLIWLAVVSPLTGGRVDELVRLCVPAFHRHGFDWSCSLIMINPRSVLGLIEIFYDRTNPEETERAQALYRELAAETLRAGYPQYRTSIAHGPHMLDGAPEFRRMLDAMKSAIDPHNIIAPGRYGLGLGETHE
ncbi:MAG: FAD-binding oxidoreductase [Acidobacteria bacterium]|nr:FAD-binding oxidoreductase [Acidobacteriota bacterium]